MCKGKEKPAGERKCLILLEVYYWSELDEARKGFF